MKSRSCRKLRGRWSWGLTSLGHGLCLRRQLTGQRRGDFKAFVPSLLTQASKGRGERDAVGDLYFKMADRGELIITEGRNVNVGQLLETAINEFGHPVAVVCDHFRLSFLKDGLEAVGVHPGIVITRRNSWYDGSEDVRGFQKGVKEFRVKTLVSLAARAAFFGARTVSDTSGNVRLATGSQGGRRQRHKDDLAAAIVLAVGTGLRHWKPGQETPPDDDVVFIAR